MILEKINSNYIVNNIIDNIISTGYLDLNKNKKIKKLIIDFNDEKEYLGQITYKILDNTKMY